MTTSRLRYAKKLRQDMTDAERCLWKHLRAHRLLGAKFRRQQPIDHYIADFVCFEAKLIIEIDGGQHLNSDSDRTRDAWFGERGYRVLRLWNNDVLGNTSAALACIAGYLPPLPNPSPARGEGLTQPRTSPSSAIEVNTTESKHNVPSPLAGEGQSLPRTRSGGEGAPRRAAAPAHANTQRLP